MTTPTIVHNDDGCQVMGHLRLGHVREDLEQWIDWIMDTPVEAYVACGANPDMCYHESKVAEQYGAREGIKTNTALLWHTFRAYEELRNQGTDYLRVLAERAGARGKQCLAGMRMSDAHHRCTHGLKDAEYALYPKYTLDHPELRIVKANGERDVTLDYSHQAVRDHRFAILEEMVCRYPVHGVELDFMRWCSHFPFPAAEAQVELMNGFMRRVRALLDAEAKRRGDGRRMVLGVRVPRTVAECAPNGLDPETWIRDGLVDYCSPAAFLFTDMNVLLDEWVNLGRDSDCEILYCLQPWWGGYWGESLKYQMAYAIELPEYRAYAANGWASGADGMHTFNVCCELPGQLKQVQEMLNAVAKPDKVFNGPRHYQFFPTAEDAGITGTAHIQRVQLTEENVPGRYRFLVGDGIRTDRIQGRLAWRIYDAVETDAWQVRLNGELIAPATIRRKSCCAGMNLRPGGGLSPHYYFEVDLRDAPTLRLHNELEITALHLEPTWDGERRMEVVEVWCEDR